MIRRPKLVARRKETQRSSKDNEEASVDSGHGNEALPQRADARASVEAGGRVDARATTEARGSFAVGTIVEARARVSTRTRAGARTTAKARARVETRATGTRQEETRREEETRARDSEDERGGGDSEDDDNVSEDDCEVNDEAVEEECFESGEDQIGEGECSDADSGDNIWDDEGILDPLASSDDGDNEDESGSEVEINEDPQELLALAKTFNSKEDFKLAVLRYSLKTGYNIEWYRSQELKIGAKCVDSKCEWRIYCGYEKRKHKMMVKVYKNEHICTKSGYTKMLKVSTIANLFAERLRVNPKMTAVEMVYEVKREYNLDVTDEQCSKTKTKVMREMKASHEKQFARIWDYQAEIFRSNEDSKFEIETLSGASIGSKLRFYRLYICFKSQRTSWKETCRPIIGLDGAFLKCDIKGQLLAAVGRDGDNRIVPIAWAVVEIENDTNWDWFVRLLAADLGLEDGRNVAVISDKQKGLVKAVHNVLPAAEHRQCAKHVFENWKKESHDVQLKRMFWKIARSYTFREYEDNTNELKRYNPNACNTLQNTNPQSWCRAFFNKGFCCNDNTNNLSESFNRTIRQARKQPLLDMLEEIRRQCMVRYARRFIIANRLKTRFTKRAHSEIDKMIERSQHCVIHMARNDEYEVELNGVGYSVNMNQRTCGCRKWQMVGIPCEHATKVIISKRQKVDEYVSDYYTTEMWRRTYLDGIRPVQGMKLWPRMRRLAVLPPPWRKRNPGRPRNYARKRGRNETDKSRLSRKHRVMACSNCKEDGHNKKTCKNPTVPDPPKKRQGGQRKETDGAPLEEEGPEAVGSQVLSQVIQQGLSQGLSQVIQQASGEGSSRWISWFDSSS